MRIYLDNCTFNRPFDDQAQIRIRLESEAKLHIQERIKDGSLKFIWSYILDFENRQNPFEERQNAIRKWKKFVELDIDEKESVLNRTHGLTEIGLKAKDALHIACAIEGKANYFLTTDDEILKKCSTYKEVSVINPLEFLKILEEQK
jgi:predicted nucleic acid-binding protein